MSKEQWGHGYHTGLSKGLAGGGKRVDLEGMLFHSYNEDGSLAWQGQLIKKHENGDYTARLFDWFDGQPTRCVVIRSETIGALGLYLTVEDLAAAHTKTLPLMNQARELIEACCDFDEAVEYLAVYAHKPSGQKYERSECKDAVCEVALAGESGLLLPPTGCSAPRSSTW